MTDTPLPFTPESEDRPARWLVVVAAKHQEDWGYEPYSVNAVARLGEQRARALERVVVLHTDDAVGAQALQRTREGLDRLGWLGEGVVAPRAFSAGIINDPPQLFRLFSNIYVDAEEADVSEDEVVLDFTGGTKSSAVAMALAAAMPGRRIQYLEPEQRGESGYPAKGTAFMAREIRRLQMDRQEGLNLRFATALDPWDQALMHVLVGELRKARVGSNARVVELRELERGGTLVRVRADDPEDLEALADAFWVVDEGAAQKLQALETTALTQVQPQLADRVGWVLVRLEEQELLGRRGGALQRELVRNRKMTPTAALAHLLRWLFGSASQLRVWVGHFSMEILDYLPAPTVSIVEFSFDAADHLGRGGYVDQDFFQILLEKFPRRSRVIVQVASIWGIVPAMPLESAKRELLGQPGVEFRDYGWNGDGEP
ncbi:MAG: hypothetical protein H6739_35765 [Alphaproteobacteria bacterium]|nr:hypothetical protein [Alphaproteobacteria bacterium]